MLYYQDITPTQFAQSALLATYATAYTAPANSRPIVKCIDVCNTTAAALQLFIHIVPTGGAALASNALAYQVTVPAYSMFQWVGVQVMNGLSFISAKGSAPGLTMTVSGGLAQ